jgi:peptidoglycan/xylan/chitin deacetylase (PgdA/CDA1 family)
MELTMGAVFSCSIDDGHPSDMKMAELLEKHGLTGTFYIPITNCEGFDVLTHSQVREIERHFDIGSHTHDHRVLNDVSIREAKYQIIEGKKRLEDVLGKKIHGFCYPRGQYRRRDVEIVQECGFSYARTTVNLCFDTGRKPFEMPTTIQFYPHDRAVYLRNFAKSGNWLKRQDGLRLAVQYPHWIDRMYALFDYTCAHGSVFHLWGHSCDFDQLNAWCELERFLSYVATRIAVEDRLTNEQLVSRYFLAPQLVKGY